MLGTTLAKTRLCSQTIRQANVSRNVLQFDEFFCRTRRPWQKQRRASDSSKSTLNLKLLKLSNLIALLFMLDFRLFRPFEIPLSGGWDWPAQQPLWPSTHRALSRGTDLLTRWTREGLLHGCWRELSYKKFHVSVFFFGGIRYFYGLKHYFYVHFVSIFSFESAFRRFTDVYSLYIGFWVCAAETAAARHTRWRILWGCVHICFSAQTRCSLWALPLCRCFTSDQGIVSWRNTSFALGDCNAVSCEEGCAVPWHFKRLFHEIR